MAIFYVNTLKIIDKENKFKIRFDDNEIVRKDEFGEPKKDMDGNILYQDFDFEMTIKQAKLLMKFLNDFEEYATMMDK